MYLRLIGTTTMCAVALVLAVGSPAAAQDRFRGLDRDGDGVITRSEWRGNDRSFRNHDRNRDGVLSGDEVRSADAGAADTDRWPGGFTDWTDGRFDGLDRDRDGSISRREWNVADQLFDRIDRNGDQVVSRREFLGLDYGEPSRDDDDGQDEGSTRFDDLDRNRDGVVTMNEWPRGDAAFRRRDADRSGALTRNELTGARARQSNAYQTGYDRGLVDGRTAGREDRTRRNRWDLDGQRELEQADAGYTTAVGARPDYQAGYRAGFRVGYEEGFGKR
jgi:Ca2+-binding EF-hand superfamily protein